jgi:hypothetical protein
MLRGRRRGCFSSPAAAPRRARGLGRSPRVFAAIGTETDYDALAACERAADFDEGGTGFGAR